MSRLRTLLVLSALASVAVVSSAAPMLSVLW